MSVFQHIAMYAAYIAAAVNLYHAKTAPNFVIIAALTAIMLNEVIKLDYNKR